MVCDLLYTRIFFLLMLNQLGIGTDATMAEHIKTIQTRGYVELLNNGHFKPTKLGEALVAGYNFIGYRLLSQPQLRAQVSIKGW